MDLLDIDPSKIYHYGSQGINDHGWGCVYRNIQTLIALESTLPVPSLQTIQRELGIAGSGGTSLWIEPVDAKRYLPWKQSLVVYTRVPHPEISMLRTTMDQVDHVVRDSAKCEEFLLSMLEKGQRVLIDDTIYSYILTGIVDNVYIYIDPHVQQNHIKQMPREQFYNRDVWMFL
tara:strand:- start:155 stop:676 length:522 start_codon:yes stop_codon:yes gene_type:complete